MARLLVLLLRDNVPLGTLKRALRPLLVQFPAAAQFEPRSVRLTTFTSLPTSRNLLLTIPQRQYTLITHRVLSSLLATRTRSCQIWQPDELVIDQLLLSVVKVDLDVDDLVLVLLG